jgi:hypothetical protein
MEHQDLQEWLDWALILDNGIYQQELGRSCFSDPQAFVNWTYHRFVWDQTPDWIRARIQESPEWRDKHPGDLPRPPQPPLPPPPQPGLRTWSALVLPTTEPIPAREYSYWSHVVVMGDAVYAMTCSSSNHPTFWRIDANGSITNMGPMIKYRGEGEGWYFDHNGEVYLIDGPRLRRVNPFDDQDTVVFDISDRYPNHNLWQAHSSDDGRVHCATVRQNSNDFNPHIATVFVVDGEKHYVEARGKQDEAHITSNGSHGVIEEDNNNRIITIGTWGEVIINDADGALSHVDCGPSYMVGEDNINGRAWKIDLPSLQRTELEQTWGMGHVSVQNGRCLLSNTGSLMWMDLNGGGLTHILDHGMRVPAGVDDPYDYQVKANMDATGTVALYMTNHGGKPSQDVVVVNLANPLTVKPRLDSAIRSHHRRHAPRRR